MLQLAQSIARNGIYINQCHVSYILIYVTTDKMLHQHSLDGA